MGRGGRILVTRCHGRGRGMGWPAGRWTPGSGSGGGVCVSGRLSGGSGDALVVV